MAGDPVSSASTASTLIITQFPASVNRPYAIAYLRYADGIFAPGIADYSQAYQAIHHLLPAHGKAVQVFHTGGYQGDIGIVIYFGHYLPASRDEADRAACRRAYENWSAILSE